MKCEIFEKVKEVRNNFLISGLSIMSEKVSIDEFLAILTT